MFSDLENTQKIGVCVHYIQFKCKKCNRIWGVLLRGKSLNELPEGWSVCANCSRKKAHEANVERMISNNELPVMEN